VTSRLPAFVLGPNPRRTLIRALVLIGASAFVFTRLLLPVRLHGTSMLPTLAEGRLGFVAVPVFWFEGPRRGQIVGIRFAGTHTMLVKRIVGMPGEVVQFVNGTVLVNGEPLAEPYLARLAKWNSKPVSLGRDEFLVVGDNRDMSMRAQQFGVAQRNRLVGPVIVWP
jgi:signal peptidase I